MEENFSMEWKMEENFSMEWKIFGMEWKWNGRKLPVWNMEKSSFIPFHTMPCQKHLRSSKQSTRAANSIDFYSSSAYFSKSEFKFEF